jgi:hypothetical protein
VPAASGIALAAKMAAFFPEARGLSCARLDDSARIALDAPGNLDHIARHERPQQPDLRHLPGDYSLATALAAAVFISAIETDGRPASRPQGV